MSGMLRFVTHNVIIKNPEKKYRLEPYFDFVGRKIFNHMNQKGFVNIIVIVLVVLLVGVIGYFVKPTPTTPTTATSSLTSNQVPPTSLVQATWKSCKNTKLGFEIQYPSEWLIYFPSGSQGAAERPPIILNSCEDADDAVMLGPKEDQQPTGIYISVCNTECLNTTIYKGARTLDVYLPKLTGTYTINADRIDGEKVATTESDLMVLFHNGAMYEIILFKYTDESTRHHLVETLKFSN